MFKSTPTLLATLLIFTTSTAAFARDSRAGCDPKKVPGAYIAVRPGIQVLDQLKLNSDGTAYSYQSTAFNFLLLLGTFIPEIGTWKCLEDGKLLVTTIGASYRPEAGDIVLDTYRRSTQKFSVIDNNTLEARHRVFSDFDLTEDPLDPNGGSIFLDSIEVFRFKRVKPLPSDLF